MMARTSIRLRLTAWYAAVLLLGLSLFGGTLWLMLDHHFMAGVDARLAQRVQGLRTVLELESRDKDPAQLQVELAEFAREVPDGSLMQLWDSAGKLILPSPNRLIFSREDTSGQPHYQTVHRD